MSLVSCSNGPETSDTDQTVISRHDDGITRTSTETPSRGVSAGGTNGSAALRPPVTIPHQDTTSGLHSKESDIPAASVLCAIDDL